MSKDMTNHEAIEFLKNMIGEESGRAIGKDGFFAELMGYHVQALKKGIAALEAETHEDTISRSDAVDAIGSWVDSGEHCLRVNAIGYLIDRIKKLPTVNAGLRTGRWIQKDKGDGFINWRCSNCGMLSRSSQRPWYKFCPDCGARMEVTE